jgi:hypothetical protein
MPTLFDILGEEITTQDLLELHDNPGIFRPGAICHDAVPDDVIKVFWKRDSHSVATRHFSYHTPWRFPSRRL